MHTTQFWTGLAEWSHPNDPPLPANEEEAQARHVGMKHPSGGNWLTCDAGACSQARDVLGYESMNWMARALRAEAALGYIPLPRKVRASLIRTASSPD